MPLLALATGYASVGNKDNWLTGLESQTDWTDSSRRFAGYRALHHGLNDMAFSLFSTVRTREVKDLLAMALAYLQSEQTDNAEAVLAEAVNTAWESIERSDLVLLQGLLMQIQQQRPLETVDPAVLDSLVQQLEITADDPAQPISVDSFCAASR